MKKRVWIALAVLCGLWGWSGCGEGNDAGDRWERAFLDPPESTKPWVYWYWISDNISKEGITRDLEAMAEVGIGEALIGNVVDPAVPVGRVSLFSEEWWSCVEHAIYEAERLGIKVGMFNCPGWSQSGGPWVQPEQAMRYLVSNEFRLSGPQRLSRKLEAPEADFQVVAVQAFPAPAEDDDRIARKSPRVNASGIRNPQALFDGNLSTTADFTEYPARVEIRLDHPVTVRSLELHPADAPMSADCKLEALGADGRWQPVSRFKIDREKLDVAIGPIRFGAVCHSFEAITAREFRLTFTNGAGGRLRSIELSGAARLSSYVEKQLGKMSPVPEIYADTYRWPESAEPESKSLVVDPGQVIDLTAQLDADARLVWEVPEGEWVVVYTGMAPTGTMNAPTTPEGRGLEVDKMNRELAQFHFDSFIGELLKRIPPEKRTGFRHVVADSYEQGSQNWTEGFAEEFMRVYGYDPYPWLPVLTGRVVENADRSDRFLWDMRRLVADRIASGYVGGLRERCEENGLRLWLENYGHWGFPGEFLNYGGASHDLGGEFWLSAPSLGPVEVRCASSAGHTYGKNVVSAEAFTSHWNFTQMPRDLKIRGDWSWCEGINHFVLHVYIHQPDERKPGMSAWFGTDFNRHSTWFSSSKSYFDYIRRSCALLQSGRPVADIAYFIGEDAPKMTGDMEPTLPAGYDYDFINSEVLMQDARVVDGRIELSSGASYAVLVLPPQETIRPEMLEKIAKLVEAGAAVYGPRPERSPSGKNYPKSDERVRVLADKMWGGIDGRHTTSNAYGAGRVFYGGGLKEALVQLGVHSDCLLPEGFLYTHRQEEGSHLYFISNQQERERNETVALRVTGMRPELWNPVTGEIRELSDYSEADGKIYIPLQFGAGDSMFIIFRKSGKPSSSGMNFPIFETRQLVDGTWSVDFSPVYGDRFRKSFPVLTDWTAQEDPEVKYYSGTATYTLSFTSHAASPDGGVFLDLGQVEGMAKVRLNGVEYPVLWRYPYRVDVSDELNRGENKLEVEITNCWWNRLVGDRQPRAEPVTWSAYIGWNEESALLPAGLLGPVMLLEEKK